MVGRGFICENIISGCIILWQNVNNKKTNSCDKIRFIAQQEIKGITKNCNVLTKFWLINSRLINVFLS